MTPEPLPGSHLAELACIKCGGRVLGIPEAAPRAMCVGCGRAHHGAADVKASEFPRVQLDGARTAHVEDGHHRGRPLGSGGGDEQNPQIYAACHTCMIEWPAADAEQASAVVSAHSIKHDPRAWASGILGGRVDKRPTRHR